MGYVQLRQGLRDALSPFWRSNPAVSDNEIIETVKRLYNEFATIDDPGWPRLLAIYMEARAAIAAAELEASFFPQVGWLLDAVHERIRPLDGYSPSTNQTRGELARRARLGV